MSKDDKAKSVARAKAAWSGAGRDGANDATTNVVNDNALILDDMLKAYVAYLFAVFAIDARDAAWGLAFCGKPDRSLRISSRLCRWPL